MDKVAGSQRKLHSEELHDCTFHYSDGHVAHMGGETACNILVGKSEETRPFRRLRYRWEDNIKMFLWLEVSCSEVNSSTVFTGCT
jgi:hypothetical protein